MAIEQERFRIIRDPKDAARWAFEIGGSHSAYGAMVGGFKSPQEARKACERKLKKDKSARRNAS